MGGREKEEDRCDIKGRRFVVGKRINLALEVDETGPEILE